MIMLSLSCSPAIISPISMYMWNKETIWKELLKLKSKIWKNIYFFIFGGVLPLRQTQGYQIFRAVRPHHRADKCKTRKKYNRQFFIYGPPMWRNMHFWLFYSYLGGPGGPLRQTQGYQIFRAVRSHYRADKFITREKNNCPFFIYGPQREKMRILGYSGGLGCP